MCRSPSFYCCHILFGNKLVSNKLHTQYKVCPDNQTVAALSVILDCFTYSGMDSFSVPGIVHRVHLLKNMDTICRGKSYYSERTQLLHSSSTRGCNCVWLDGSVPVHLLPFCLLILGLALVTWEMVASSKLEAEHPLKA